MGDKGLSQNDFRSLLMTPRSVSAGSQTPRGGEARPKKEKSYKPPRPKDKDKDKEEGSTGSEAEYRDRAKERREGRLGDYEETQQMLSSFMKTDNPDLSKLSAEDSKYFGGEYTHLVKGLDFALLEKVKKEIEKEEEANPSQAAQAAKEQEEKVTFRTPLGKKIFDEVQRQKKPPAERNEHFFPGRTFFRFELDEDFGSDIPTLVMRSNAEFAEYQSKLVAASNDIVITKVVQLISHIREGLRANEKPKKLKKKDKGREKENDGGKEKDEPAKPAEKPAPKPVIDMDDDIFPDAGKYVPALEEKHAEPALGKPKPQSYFEKPLFDEEVVQMDTDALEAFPALKNISVEGASFAVPEAASKGGFAVPSPKQGDQKAKPQPPEGGASDMSSDQISAITSLVKGALRSSKEEQKKRLEQEREEEERRLQKQREEEEERLKKERELFREQNLFRAAGGPIVLPKGKNEDMESYESFLNDNSDDEEIPKTKEPIEADAEGPKKGKKTGKRTEKDKFARDAKAVGQLLENKYGIKEELGERANKRRKTE